MVRINGILSNGTIRDKNKGTFIFRLDSNKRLFIKRRPEDKWVIRSWQGKSLPNNADRIRDIITLSVKNGEFDSVPRSDKAVRGRFA